MNFSGNFHFMNDSVATQSRAQLAVNLLEVQDITRMD